MEIEGGGEAEKLKAAAKAMEEERRGDKTVLAAYRNDLKTADIRLSLVRRQRKREGNHCQRIGGGTAGEKTDCCGGGQKPYY